MKKTLLGITWASFQHVKWTPVLLVVAAVIYYCFNQRKKLMLGLASPKWIDSMIHHFRAWAQPIKAALWGVTAASLFLAVLQPQWGNKEQVVEQEGRELFVGLDISRSMLVADIKPHRLAFAKAKIKRLLKLLPSDRVGLLVFSGAAVQQCPLTRDNSAFKMFLDQVDAETISSGTTAIDQAISAVIKIMEKTPTRKNKILVLFTDGEDFSTDLSVVREKAQEIGLHIFTYGVGTAQGGPVPIINRDGKTTGYEKNQQGNVFMSQLNEGILQSLARETGGKYISPTQSDDDLNGLVATVEQYEKEKFEDKELSTEEDRYPFFLAVSFIALLVEWLL